MAEWLLFTLWRKKLPVSTRPLFSHYAMLEIFLMHRIPTRLWGGRGFCVDSFGVFALARLG